MGGRSSRKVRMLLLVVCMATMVSPGLTCRDDSEEEDQECWSSIIAAKGCINEALEGLSLGRAEVIGSPCCMAFHTISDECWSLIFPDLVYREFLQSCSSETQYTPTVAAPTLAPAVAPMPTA